MLKFSEDRTSMKEDLLNSRFNHRIELPDNEKRPIGMLDILSQTCIDKGEQSFKCVEGSCELPGYIEEDLELSALICILICSCRDKMSE